MRKKLEALFYSTANGCEPVREWLIALSRPDKKIIGEDIKSINTRISIYFLYIGFC